MRCGARGVFPRGPILSTPCLHTASAAATYQ
jgi:hypothetical protein